MCIHVNNQIKIKYLNINLKNDACVMHQQDRLLSCQLRPTLPPVVEGMRLTEL